MVTATSISEVLLLVESSKMVDLLVVAMTLVIERNQKSGNKKMYLWTRLLPMWAPGMVRCTSLALASEEAGSEETRIELGTRRLQWSNLNVAQNLTFTKTTSHQTN